MPVEVKKHEYLCQYRYYGDPEPPRKRRRITCTSDSDTSDDSDADELVQELGPFRYNPLHDLESLWWISAYFLLSRTLTLTGDNAERTDAEDPRLARQRTAAQKLFVIGDERQWAVCGESEFYREFKTLRPLTRKMGRALDIARDTLVRAYHYVEQDLDNRAFEVRSEVYEEMCEIYTKIAKRLEGEDVMTGHLKIW